MEYKFFKRTSFYIMILCALIATIYYACPAQISLTATYYLAVTIVIITAIVKFSMLNKTLYSKEDYLLDLFESLVSAIIAIICLNFGQEYIILSIICGIVYLVFPITRFIIAEYKINQMFLDSFKYLCAFVIITSNYHYIFWMKYVLGTVFCLSALAILLIKLKHLKAAKEGRYFYE